MADLILALDQGTTSSRSVVFNRTGQEVTSASRAFPVTYPRPGWVEQDPEMIWESQLETTRKVVEQVGAKNIACAGITNQRETVLAWDRRTGSALSPAVVWQCRRSSAIIDAIKGSALEAKIRERTGLVLDSYFSGSKIQWLLENVSGLREKVNSGEAVFGTVDAFLAFRFSRGKIFQTEPSNASRTMLFDIRSGQWDGELCATFGISPNSLPPVADSIGKFGWLEVDGAKIPLTGILGDQQASLFGHGAFSPNEAKCTFGTGAFLLLNTGNDLIRSASGLLSTVAWKFPGASSTYALEGSVFVAGSVVQWLRDGLKIIQSSAEVDQLAQSVASVGDIILVPALTGLGSPYWDMNARGLIIGLTRDSTSAHIARAALEGVAHQTADLLDTPEFAQLSSLSIDGGMGRSQLFCRQLATATGRKILRAPHTETTAFGVALAAAVGAGMLSLAEVHAVIGSGSTEIENGEQIASRKRWKDAVALCRGWVD